ASNRSRDAIEDIFAAFPPGEAVDLAVSRAGKLQTLTLKPVPACNARFEVVPSDTLIARSQGKTIQISTRFVEAFGEEGTAVAAAHEFAHLVLKHGTRSSKASERQADRLSIRLLAAAGFDPHIAPRFWREHGASMGSRGHDPVGKRIELLETEIAALEAR
ncbi:MAG: hypothetical protein ACKOOL_03590, partial [Novosphingobium sp.]